jgi:hypothetical protein
MPKLFWFRVDDGRQAVLSDVPGVGVAWVGHRVEDHRLGPVATLRLRCPGRQALAPPGLAGGGEQVLTQPVAADPPVAALRRARGLEAEPFEAEMPGGACLLRRLALPPR